MSFLKRSSICLCTLFVLQLLASNAPGRAGRGIAVSTRGQDDTVLQRCIGGDAQNPRDRVANFEPYAAVNPRNSENLAAVWMASNNNYNHRYVIRVAVSFDGGRQWTRPQTLPFTACSGGERGLDVATDSWVAFGPDGLLYVSAQTYAGIAGGHNGVQHITVITSPDGGRTWGKASGPIVDKGPRVKFDNSYIIADPVHPLTAYVLTSRYDFKDEVLKTLTPQQISKGNDPEALLQDLSRPKPVRGYRATTVAMAKTNDGGKTWSPQKSITPLVTGALADFPQMVIDPRTDRLSVFYSGGVNRGGIYMVSSSDMGANWTEPLSVSEYVPVTSDLHPFRGGTLNVAPDIIHTAIDPRSGRLYVVFSDGRFTHGNYLQVGITSSSDGGYSWTKPVPVSRRGDQSAWMPAIAVGRQGIVAVTYFDGRGFTTSPEGRPELNLWRKTFSLDSVGHLTRENETLVDHFDLRGKPGESGFLADYVAVLAVGDSFHSVYARTAPAGAERTGTKMGSSQTGDVSTQIFFSF